jgi:excisionase family DNA binding protein
MPESHMPVRDPIIASADEIALLRDIGYALDCADGTRPTLIAGPTGEVLELPDPLVRAIRQATALLARERAVMIVGIERDLTTQEAADLLNVSRPYLVQLLESGEIPFGMVGSHRRVRFDDLMAYKHARDTQLREGLRRLTQMSQEFGLYPPPSGNELDCPE